MTKKGNLVLFHTIHNFLFTPPLLFCGFYFCFPPPPHFIIYFFPSTTISPPHRPHTQFFFYYHHNHISIAFLLRHHNISMVFLLHHHISIAFLLHHHHISIVFFHHHHLLQYINIFHLKTNCTNCNNISYLWKTVLGIKLSAPSWKTQCKPERDLFKNFIGLNKLISFKYALCTINRLDFIE